MKNLIFVVCIIFIMTGVAFSEPYLRTVPVIEAVTSYKLILDGTEYTEMPFTSQSGTVQMVKDMAPLNLANGVHTGTIQAFNTLWGIKTDAVPFEFTKPGDLTDPVIGLASTDPRL